jgi:glycine cleavage system aminomethyltransferase T
MADAKSLEDVLNAAKNPVEFLRNRPTGPYVYPMPSEHSNWRDEQRAWQQTCVLFDQSYHMTDIYIEGPDALRLLSDTAINTFKGFSEGKAKQYVSCTPAGHVIGDGVLTWADGVFDLIGRPSMHNWLTYQAEIGGYDVKLERDERSAARQGPPVRKAYRYQVQGPNAMKTIEAAIGKAPPELKFFHMCELTIAGRRVHGLRHGMAGQAGFELFGPWEDREAVREAIVRAGEEFGLRQVGARAYSSNTLESGWIPSPMPGIYAGDELKAYREWLPANGYEANASLGGSFVSDRIEDYFLTPYELGYGPFVKFDHDFIGREALQAIHDRPHRKKVTLALDDADVARVIATQFGKQDRAKFFDWPSAVYSTLPYDAVVADGKTVGISTWIGYSSNERKALTLAILDPEWAEPGREVTLLWGEPSPTAKLTAETHTQTEIRAIVSPVPYAEVARTQYAEGWRTAQTA